MQTKKEHSILSSVCFPSMTLCSIGHRHILRILFLIARFPHNSCKRRHIGPDRGVQPLGNISSSRTGVQRGQRQEISGLPAKLQTQISTAVFWINHVAILDYRCRLDFRIGSDQSLAHKDVLVRTRLLRSSCWILSVCAALTGAMFSKD